MKKLSIKGLAEFMIASPSRKRTILRHYKYPAEDEPKAKILYYRDARERIVAYHAGGHDREWLLEEVKRLQILTSLSSGQSKTRLSHNVRALRAYLRNFSGFSFEVLDDVLLNLQFGDVVITVRPDLHIIEKQREKIVKLEFGKAEPSKLMIKIISQGMFESTEIEGMNLQSSDVLFLDVPRGKRYKGARMGSRIRRDIEATCEMIDAIWDRI